jgi:hypothetical protein
MKTIEKIETNVSETELASYDAEGDIFNVDFDAKQVVDDLAKEWEQKPIDFLYRVIAASIHCLRAATDDDLKDIWNRQNELEKRIKKLEKD